MSEARPFATETARRVSPPAPAGVRALSGLVLTAYRLAFALLVLAAIAVTGWSLRQPAAEPAILILRLVKATILIAVSAILFRRRQRDPVAAMLSLAFLLWTISSTAQLPGQSLTSPALLDRLRFLFFALALLLFPDGQWRPRWTRHIAVAVVAVFLVGVVEALGLSPTRLFLPPAIACVLAAMFALVLRYRRLRSLEKKQQLKWVALGLFAGVGLILTARGGAALTAGMAMPPIGPVVLDGLFQLGIVIVALGFLTSLLRYRLYDAETAISRSAVVAALTVVLVGIFAASEALIELFGQRYLASEVGNVSGAIAAAIAAVLLAPLHNRISGWAEHYFQRDLVVLKAELPELLAELPPSSAPGDVAAAALPRMREAVQATRAALLLDSRLVGMDGIGAAEARAWAREWREPMQRDGVQREVGDRLFPLRMPLRCPFGNVRGWLLLGPRPDGSLYGHDDLEALAAVAPALRQTLFAAREREREKARERRWRREAERTLASLTERLTALEARA